MGQFPPSERFEFLRRLGEGGMGVVFEARDRNSGAIVALKALRHIDPQAVYRLKNEFRALQDLEHPNLVSLGELFEVHGEWFFTMELVAGTDFLSFVRPGRRALAVDVSRLRDGFAQLARGLAALHAGGKIHRDVKPSNVRVTPEGRVVLLDFGLVVERDAGRSTEAHVVGTAAYMAPEQAAADRLTPAADWYAAGVMLYQALTGRVPFTGTPMKIFLEKQQREPAAPRSIAPDVPEDLDRLCMELLRFDPRMRPDAAVVIERLGAPALDVAATSSTSQISHTPPFMGRERELAICAEAFERVRDGETAAVFVHGDSGVGKSALLRHFADRVQGETGDAVVLAGRCYERELVPYKAFDGVVDELVRYLRGLAEADVAALVPRNASLLSRVFPVLARVEAIAAAPLPRAEIRDPHEVRARAFAALRGLLGAIADRHPLLVIIDDIQWADAESGLLLNELLRPPEPPPLLLLVSSREERFHVPGAVRRVPLAPLDPDIARSLAKALLERSKIADAVSPAAIATEAMGHPLYIDELVRHVALTGAVDARVPRLDDAIWARVRQLPEAARHLIELLAVAGAPLAVDTLAQAAKLDPARVSRQLATLRVANFIRGAGTGPGGVVEPYHDRVREAIAASLDGDTRLEHHRRLALALESSGVAAERPQLLLRHLEAAGEATKAALLAEQAAHRASETLAFDRAAELFATALRLREHDGPRRRELLIALGDALANAGRGAEAAREYLHAQQDADDDLRLELRRRAADTLLKTGHVREGLLVLEDVFSQVGGRFPRSPGEALRMALVTRARLWMRGNRWTPRPARDIRPGELTRIDVHSTASQGLAMIDTVRGAAIGARALWYALQTGERFRALRQLLLECTYLATAGGRRLRQGRALWRRLEAELRDDDDPYLHALCSVMDGAIAYYEGEFDRGLDQLARGAEMLRQRTTGTVWEINVVRVFQAFTMRRAGRLRGLRQLHDSSVRDAELRGDRFTLASLTRLTHFIWMADARPELGEATMDEAHWEAQERFDLQSWFDVLARTELAMYRGMSAADHERVEAGLAALYRSQLPRVILPLRLDARVLEARIGLYAGTPEGVAKARKLAGLIDRERLGYASNWATLVRAGYDARSGRPDDAAAGLREAIRGSDGAGQPLEAAAARWQLGRLIGGDEGAALGVQAEAWMASERIADPAAMSRFLIPGFVDPSSTTS